VGEKAKLQKALGLRAGVINSRASAWTTSGVTANASEHGRNHRQWKNQKKHKSFHVIGLHHSGKRTQRHPG